MSSDEIEKLTGIIKEAKSKSIVSFFMTYFFVLISKSVPIMKAKGIRLKAKGGL
jgi:hypothetical protein